MRIRRTLPILFAVVIVAVALTFAVQLRKHAPPEPARLLPGADAFVYLNLDKARKANAGHELPAVSHDPEYERFIRETGFQFERDLDEAAFAIHYPASGPGGGTGGASVEPKFSEVFVGKFQGERVSAYLRQIAKSVENYHSVDIFTIRVESRSLRVALLSADLIAASNHEGPAVIQGMIDRSKRLASPFGGPALLRQYYKDVQFASLAWAIARIEPAALGDGTFSAIFTKPATLVVSASALNPLHPMTPAIHLRAEAFTQSPDDARAITDKVNVFLAITHSAESSVSSHGTDSDVKALFESVQIKQNGDRAVLTASMPYGFLHKMLAGSPPDLSQEPVAPSPAPANKQPAKSK
ncbi:MAG: hypothetical protein ACLQLC_02760 [Candidatus Sulfotelmatobacter sp.]